MNESMDRTQHPDAEVLGVFVEGNLDAERTAEIAKHLSTCNDCLDAVGAAARSIREDQPRPAGAHAWWSRRTLSIAAAAVIVLVGLTALRQVLRSGPSSLEELVAAAPRNYRPVEPRLAGFRWAAMHTYRGAEPSISTEDPEFLRMAGAAGEALRRATENENSADDVHAAGVGQLLLREPAAAVPLLEKAAGLQRDDARVWSDLAAAQLSRAIQERRPSELPAALASADTALRIDPRSPEALFNRALILENLDRRDDAAKTWRNYLEVDPSSEWAGEAREHLGWLEPEKPLPGG